MIDINSSSITSANKEMVRLLGLTGQDVYKDMTNDQKLEHVKSNLH